MLILYSAVTNLILTDSAYISDDNRSCFLGRNLN